MARSVSEPRARALVLALALGWASGCGDSGGADGDGPAARVLGWAEVLEAEPDPAVVTDEGLRARLRATGLPWRVRALGSGIELLLVPPGEFSRGAAADDAEATDDERPQHTVRVAEPFYLGRYEVTQDEWRRVLGDEPSFFTAPVDAAGRFPVEQVALFRAQEFLRLTELELPTESQWEYACRAGDPAPRHGRLEDIAWHHGNARGRPRAIGTRAPNALGFHDMLGNVWEWTSSGFLPDEYARHHAPLDARKRAVGTTKAVLRGGSWYDPPKRVRASARYSVERDFVGGHVGFRALRSP
jgi:formylglycine-generating enzyme required for sulfatase activity